MKLIDISLSSLIRQKGKKSFLLIAIILGCATVVTLFTFIESQKNKIEAQFDEFGANIVILPKSDNLSLSYGGINVSSIVANLEELKLSDVQKIWEIPNKKNIRSVSPKILGAAKANVFSEEKQILLVGVNFSEERKMKNWWDLDGKYPENLMKEIVIGADVADKLSLNIGSNVNVLGENLTVSGRLKPTGSQDDGIIFADFDFVSRFLDKKGVVSLVEVSALCSDCPIEDIITQISGILPNATIKGIRQVMKQKMDTVAQFEKFAFTMTAVIIMIGAILILTSMMGAVAERTHEIGIFRAIGFKKSHIISIILSEAFIVSAAAGVLGILAGLSICYIALPRLTDIEIDMLVVQPVLLLSSLLGVVLLGLTASLYPAYKVADIDPVIALSSL